MPTYNYKSRELIAKIVYYGPGRCGKTTNLQQIHQRMRPETRSELLSVATETDRTIYFDLLPLNLGTISGMKFMVRLFTVPGQVYYSETRKLVLRGADGIVFVADSQDHMMDENRQSLRDLRDNLAANGLDYSTIPLIMQWNKRDLPHLISEAELDATLNDRRVKSVNAVASLGEGVLETLRHITLSVFNHIKAGGKGAKTRPATGTQPAMGQHATNLGMPGGMPGALAAQGTGVGSATAGPGAAAVANVGAMPVASVSNTNGGAKEAHRAASMGSWSSALPRPNFASGASGSASTNGQGAPGAPGTSRENAPSTRAGGFGPPPPPPPGSSPPHLSPHGASGAPHSGGGVITGRERGEPGRPLPISSPHHDDGSLEPHGPQPVRISVEMVVEEFQSLALAQSQMSERIATIENQLARLGRENQELREILARR